MKPVGMDCRSIPNFKAGSFKPVRSTWAVWPETLPTGANVSEDINVVALVKGEERYIFLFDDEKKGEALRTLGRYASDTKLSFSWYDAAVLSQKVRNIEKSQPVPDAVNDRLVSPQIEDLLSGEDLFSGEDNY